MKMFLLFIGLLLSMHIPVAYASDLRFSGFEGEVISSATGGPNEDHETTLSGQSGKGSPDGNTITGVDVDLTKEMTFLADVNFQFARQKSNEFK